MIVFHSLSPQAVVRRLALAGSSSNLGRLSRDRVENIGREPGAHWSSVVDGPAQTIVTIVRHTYLAD